VGTKRFFCIAHPADVSLQIQWCLNWKAVLIGNNHANFPSDEFDTDIVQAAEEEGFNFP